MRKKASALSLGEIRSSLARLRTTFDFPVADPALGEAPGAATLPRVARSAGSGAPAPVSSTSGAGTPWRGVTLGQIIEAGLVRLPLDIERPYRGTTLMARIEAADRIVFNGVSYDSLSTAGGMARKSIVGEKGGQPYP